MGNDEFLAGVIEGFYSRPWTRDQRLDLFSKMKKYKLNAYLYAPKDDLKHRSLWRDLYTEEECCILKNIIDCCKENDVTFYYGISPGLDIRYSNKDEVDLLVDKVKQVEKLGCTGFAILWDDIEPELKSEDARHFTSFGDAHCKVSNLLFSALSCPAFLFCPVEYCSSRAKPKVKSSEYLTCIGEHLDQRIKVFWTGGKVVSETITVKEIQELTKVIKRKPVIWDNLHANDYDNQRLFLGPYAGREKVVPLTQYLSGAMTNPNCEYSLNLPAIVTLADWANNNQWDPSGNNSHRLALREMLEECKKSGPGTESTSLKRLNSEEDELTEEDLDLIFQIFWLPHSHGPKVRQLLADFQYCQENSLVMKGWKEYDPGSQPVCVDQWIDRAQRINSFGKQINNVVEKLSHIRNREMLYDLSPYLTSARVEISACTAYIKWVCCEDLKKPLKGFPALAGLQGGLVGDLMRLYPIKKNTLFPLKKAPITADTVLVLPARNLTTTHNMETLHQLFQQEFTKFAPLIPLAEETLFLKKKTCNEEGGVAGEFTTAGLIVVWDPIKLDKTSIKDLDSNLHEYLSKQSQKRPTMLVKIFLSDCRVDPSVMKEILLSSAVAATYRLGNSHSTVTNGTNSETTHTNGSCSSGTNNSCEGGNDGSVSVVVWLEQEKDEGDNSCNKSSMSSSCYVTHMLESIGFTAGCSCCCNSEGNTVGEEEEEFPPRSRHVPCWLQLNLNTTASVTM